MAKPTPQNTPRRYCTTVHARRGRTGCATLLLGVALMTAFGPAAGAQAADGEACRTAIEAVEPGSGLPPGLLAAIARVESGRRDPLSGRVEPWPWAINVAGQGLYAATRAEAVAVVASHLARGTRSIDVGCMQVNLLHHPMAFPDLETAFDPQANLRYAASFLAELHRRAGGDWARAIAWYHSATPERGAAYHWRVLAALGGAPTGAVPPAAATGGVLVIVPRALSGEAAGRAPMAMAASPLPSVFVPNLPRELSSTSK